MEFSDTVRPVALPSSEDETFEGAEAIVAGWGEKNLSWNLTFAFDYILMFTLSFMQAAPRPTFPTVQPSTQISP